MNDCKEKKGVFDPISQKWHFEAHGESADSFIFFPLAFGGLVPVQELLKMMAIQIFAKTAYEIVVLPLTIRVVSLLKHVEGMDAYDTDISYNILKIKEI